VYIDAERRATGGEIRAREMTALPHNRRDGLDGAHDLHTYAGAEVKMETAYRREEMCRRSFKRTASPAIGVRTFLHNSLGVNGVTLWRVSVQSHAGDRLLAIGSSG
jgi:hypothetical protein